MIYSIYMIYGKFYYVLQKQQRNQRLTNIKQRTIAELRSSSGKPGAPTNNNKTQKGAVVPCKCIELTAALEKFEDSMKIGFQSLTGWWNNCII
jgi:hypothetical protein